MGKTAVITGASSGIGAALARHLSAEGYDLLLCGQNEARLLETAKACSRETELFLGDISDRAVCERLCEKVRTMVPEMLVNNAGLGVFGDFDTADADRIHTLVELNCTALTQVMHAGLQVMKTGTVLNVASVAGLLPAGPHLAAYYASKAYVVSLSLGVRRELKEKKSGVTVCTLCPGPVDTRFNERAGVRFALPGRDADAVALAALRGMKKDRALIVPGPEIKLSVLASHLLPRSVMTALTSGQQKKKG